MTTPTPQDIARAEEIVGDPERFYRGNGFHRLTQWKEHKLAIASALAAERSRWQAAAYDDAKQAAVNPMLYEDGDGPLDLQHRIGNAIDFRKRLAIAQPATAEREVMHSGMAPEGCEREAIRETSVAPPQPAPSPAGAIDVVHLRELADTHFHEHPHTARMLIGAAAELTRLRSAPTVTEEMVERAKTAFAEKSEWVEGSEAERALNACWRAALTAALTPGGE